MGALKSLLEKQQYRFVGKHSAVKICTWTKKSLRDEDVCYKQKFYGIRSHLCCQMTPAVNNCPNSCIFCWRPQEFTLKVKGEDEPKDIVKNCILGQRGLLSGFGGNHKVNLGKLEEAQEPMHFAISLSGEPTAYSKLNELIKELHKLGKTTFLVTNGMFPEKLDTLELPTQLYLSVDAPNKELFEKIDRCEFTDGWERLNKSLEILKSLKDKTRTIVRITLIRGINDCNVKGYVELLKKGDPDYIELKAYMWVGFSRDRLKIENMPRHEQVVEFAKELIKKYPELKIIDEKKESRVVLLGKEDKPDRIMKCQ
ncbi:4-demethylwyosine synthase TYW1 [Candidatus Woesearchaeota archaeon]|nr:4-demethylwyosine synthase TYW1 [Candidatus Woesearchaeota archaeon]MBW3021813.1 4-demethylwyosine synthase TYW1 [Candidatus Woesearchaeota archaeon]